MLGGSTDVRYTAFKVRFMLANDATHLQSMLVPVLLGMDGSQRAGIAYRNWLTRAPCFSLSPTGVTNCSTALLKLVTSSTSLLILLFPLCDFVIGIRSELVSYPC